MSSNKMVDVAYVLIILAIFVVFMIGREWLTIKKFRKNYDPTLKLAISKENKRTFLIYLALAIVATIFLLVVLPVAGVIPIMLVILLYQSKLIWVGDTHIYQSPNCLIIDKMKHARLDVKGSTKTLSFKYKNNHLTMNISLMDETEIMKRLK